jgi:hypothetical protein
MVNQPPQNPFGMGAKTFTNVGSNIKSGIKSGIGGIYQDLKDLIPNINLMGGINKLSSMPPSQIQQIKAKQVFLLLLLILCLYLLNLILL